MTQTNPEITPCDLSSKCGTDYANMTISNMVDLANYFLTHVIIFHLNDGFYLWVFNFKDINMVKRYSTLNGAKLAFYNSFRYRAQLKERVPSWIEIIPCSKWFEEILKPLKAN